MRQEVGAATRTMATPSRNGNNKIRIIKMQQRVREGKQAQTTIEPVEWKIRNEERSRREGRRESISGWKTKEKESGEQRQSRGGGERERKQEGLRSRRE